METLIPARAYGQVWRRFAHYCSLKRLDPFSYVSLGIWMYDISAVHSDEFFVLVEVEIIDEIISAAQMLG